MDSINSILFPLSVTVVIMGVLYRESYFIWLAYVLSSIASIIQGMLDFMAADYIHMGINAAFACYFILRSWQGRNNSKNGEKANKNVGEKTRAMIKKMTSKLTHSPIPQPSNS